MEKDIDSSLTKIRGTKKLLSVSTASEHDFNRIMEIYRYAQDYMIRSGNPSQWGHAYPEAEMIKADIRTNRCKVIHDNKGIHGVFALFDGEDPTYNYIENGEWLNDDPYITIHRIAGDGQVHGLLSCAVSYCRSICSNIRIDTHEDNKIMQRQIEKNGFRKCGTIYLENGAPRLAYHLVIK
ncbi:N-acetyltransferase [Butyrivibrio sp. INlla16]|uniref:N-acetyltransferase n=1 Tax=Butyrivibrio sp. INlla16 TaxID=1520807 RepID=UPI001FA6DA16|nr:N-acetyltransferase [Butyrivibrio sp. INlla16]